MKKTTRALVVMSLLGAPVAAVQAQSIVTIYGALDAFVASQWASGVSGSVKSVGSGFNPNAFGFSGTEDLGGGLRAGFVLEGQPLLDTGTYSQGGKVWGRQSLVFLSGPWGRVGLGRQHTPGRAFGVKYSTTGWLSTDPLGNLQLAMGAAISPAMNPDTVGGRLNNSITYISPNVAGFTLSAIQSAGEGGPFSNGQAKVTMLGLGYASDLFDVDAAYSHIPVIAGSQLKQTDYGLGVTLKTRMARFQAAYQRRTAMAVAAPGALTGVAGSNASDQLFTIGAMVPLSDRDQVGVAVGRLSAASAHRGLRQANLSAPFSSLVDDVTAWSVSYQHSLSKRTQLFAAYGSLNNDGLGTASLAPGMRPTAGGTSRMLGAGLRHSF